MVRYRLRKDKLISEDNVCYVAYGVNVYNGLKKVRSIRDVSLDKIKLAELIKKCNNEKVHPSRLDDIIQRFVDDEYTISEKPCFPR